MKNFIFILTLILILLYVYLGITIGNFDGKYIFRMLLDRIYNYIGTFPIDGVYSLNNNLLNFRSIIDAFADYSGINIISVFVSFYRFFVNVIKFIFELIVYFLDVFIWLIGFISILFV